jgi:hypothetical protein
VAAKRGRTDFVASASKLVSHADPERAQVKKYVNGISVFVGRAKKQDRGKAECDKAQWSLNL